ncbi:MAG: hypothetical protein ACETVR_03145 [Candidatus Bathyarchaeia archaeon]
MEFKVRNLIKGIVSATITYLFYGVIPGIIMGQVLRTFPFYEVEPGLITVISVVSVALAVFTFLRSFFPSKSVAHAAAGFGGVFFSALYLWLWSGGYAGSFGYFTIHFGFLDIAIDSLPLLRFMLLTVLLNSTLYVIDLVEIYRKKVPEDQLPPYLVTRFQEE